jgi:hypothetical protein
MQRVNAAMSFDEDVSVVGQKRGREEDDRVEPDWTEEESEQLQSVRCARTHSHELSVNC